MRLWIYWVLLVWGGLPALACANQPAMDDFAYGFEILVPEHAAVAAMAVPESVYKSAYRADLGDIRVFNSDGEPVPHLLRTARTQSADAPWHPLPYFPIPGDRSAGTNDYRLYVRTGPDGAVVRIQPQMPSLSNPPQRTVLIDLSRIEIELAELRLTWPPGSMNRLAFFSVAGSDDLIHWTSLQSRAVISDVTYGDHRLSHNVIALPPTRQRYLRLRQLDKGPPVLLTALQGRAKPRGRTMVHGVSALAGQPVPDEPGEYEYDTGGAYPVDRVNLLFDQANSMADAQLSSRATRNGEWIRRCEGLFYRIDFQGTPITSAPLPVAVSMDRYWRLSVDASDSTLGRRVPRLEIGYRPHDLFFLARGDGPFTLAFGSSRAQPLKTNVAALVDSISQNHGNGIQNWVFPQGARFELGGADRLTPKTPPLPTRRIILWSILVVGVLIVGAMAWRLARRLRL